MWRHVVGLGWLGAGSMRTRRAAHVCALLFGHVCGVVWHARPRSMKTHENARRKKLQLLFVVVLVIRQQLRVMLPGVGGEYFLNGRSRLYFEEWIR